MEEGFDASAFSSFFCSSILQFSTSSVLNSLVLDGVEDVEVPFEAEDDGLAVPFDVEDDLAVPFEAEEDLDLVVPFVVGEEDEEDEVDEVVDSLEMS